jgi:hypothetical protein
VQTVARKVLALRRGAGPSASNPLEVRRVVVNDKMQKAYVYYCAAPPGRQFAEDFVPYDSRNI